MSSPRSRELPGVWRRRDGGFHVRARTTDPRTNKLREVNRELPNVSRAKDAYAWLQGELERIRAGSQPEVSTAPAFHALAAEVFKRKVDLGKIRSAAGRAKWESVLETHLYPAFGDILMDQLRSSDIKGWQAKIAARIKAGAMAPTTANTILSVLRQITDEAVEDYDLRDPMRGVDMFDTREHNTYSEEEPNSLAPEDVPRFLGKLRELHPEHFAFASSASPPVCVRRRFARYAGTGRHQTSSGRRASCSSVVRRRSYGDHEDRPAPAPPPAARAPQGSSLARRHPAPS